jgi:hypothetical protein
VNDAAALWVKADRLCKGKDLASAVPLTGNNYMLLRLERRDVYEDWDSIASIQEPYDDAIDLLPSLAAADGEAAQKVILQEADKRFAAALRAAQRAKELTKVVGKNQAVATLKQRYAEAKKNAIPGARADDFVRKLSAVMARPVLSVEEAALLGEIPDEHMP